MSSVTSTVPISSNAAFQLSLQQVQADVEALQSRLSVLSSRFPHLEALEAQLPAIDYCQLNVCFSFALSSLYFAYLRSQGIDHQSHPVSQELARVKLAMKQISQLKEAADVEALQLEGKQPRVDPEVAKRIVTFYTGAASRDRDSNTDKIVLGNVDNIESEDRAVDKSHVRVSSRTIGKSNGLTQSTDSVINDHVIRSVNLESEGEISKEGDSEGDASREEGEEEEDDNDSNKSTTSSSSVELVSDSRSLPSTNKCLADADRGSESSLYASGRMGDASSLWTDDLNDGTMEKFDQQESTVDSGLVDDGCTSQADLAEGGEVFELESEGEVSGSPQSSEREASLVLDRLTSSHMEAAIKSIEAIQNKRDRKQAIRKVLAKAESLLARRKAKRFQEAIRVSLKEQLEAPQSGPVLLKVSKVAAGVKREASNSTNSKAALKVHRKAIKGLRMSGAFCKP